MDELFRRAAEDYPLDTGSPDWSGLRKKMDAASANKPNKPGKDRPYRNFLLVLLFLLIPFKILFNDSMQPAGGLSTTSTGNGILRGERTRDSKYANVAGNTALNQTISNNIERGVQPSRSFKKVKPYHSQSKTSLTAFNNATVYSGEKKSGKKPSLSASKLNVAINPSIQQEEGLSPVTSTSNIEEPIATVITKNSVEETKKGVIIEKAKEADKKSDDNSAKKDKPNKRSPRHFYAGIIAGPDVSAVKLQSVKKAGFGFGIVTGYRFNKRWSIESGLLLDKKYYSTDGKYFSTKNIQLPNYVQIDHADGSCDMLEIPVNIRYNFKKSGTGWFASAGISSYLMKEEYYDYDMTRYGVSYTRNFTYNESRNTLMAVLNLSGGYSYKLGKIGDLRIEPYIKLPLRKIGIGSLPLQSAGVYIALTKFIF